MAEYPFQLMDTTIYAVPTPPDYRKILQGSNQKQTLIVFISEEGIERTTKIAFLEKIFSAIGLDLNTDTHTIGAPAAIAKTFAYSDLVNLDDYKKVFFFGYQTSDLGLRINTALYSAVKLHNRQIFLVDDLSVLETDKAKKLALWNYLQKTFPKV